MSTLLQKRELLTPPQREVYYLSARQNLNRSSKLLMPNFLFYWHTNTKAKIRPKVKMCENILLELENGTSMKKSEKMDYINVLNM